MISTKHFILIIIPALVTLARISGNMPTAEIRMVLCALHTRHVTIKTSVPGKPSRTQLSGHALSKSMIRVFRLTSTLYASCFGLYRTCTLRNSRIAPYGAETIALFS